MRFYEPSLTDAALASINATLEPNTRFAPESYYRILAADLLPSDIHRALCLDGDIICTGSLEGLFEADLKGCPVGMCYNNGPFDVPIHNLLRYPLSEGYFNSGVMLLDLDLWRKENITKTMLDYLAVNSNKLLTLDQDLINAVLHGKIFSLDFAYNMHRTCFYVFYWAKEEQNNYFAHQTQYLLREDWPALLAACESPRLVHMAGGLKPWHRECDLPFTPVWRYFHAQSPWKDEPLQWFNPPMLKKRIKRLGRKAFEALHIIEKRLPSGIPWPEEAYKVAQRVLNGLLAEDARK